MLGFKDLKAKRSGVYAVNPKIAVALLEQNIGNRGVKTSAVQRYAEDMRNGNWLEGSHDPIMVDTNNRLINGQHRLHSVVVSKATIPLVIEFDINPKLRSVLDQGIPRTNADVLRLERESPHAAATANALRLLHQHKTGQMEALCHIQKQPAVSGQSVLDEFDKHPDMVQFFERREWITSIFIGRYLGKPQAAFIHYVFKSIDPKKAELFFRQLAFGEMLTHDDAVYHLRERLQSSFVGPRSKRLKAIERIAICFKAWQLINSRKKIKGEMTPTRWRGLLRWSITDKQSWPKLDNDPLCGVISDCTS